MDQDRELSAGEVARRAGVSKDTLRHYERIGVLPAPERADNGYRRYSEQHVERALLIRRAVAVGFRLNELSGFLGVRDTGEAPCRKVYGALERKRDEVERRLAELIQLRDDLNSILADWRIKLDTGDEPVMLLESIPSVSRRTQ